MRTNYFFSPVFLFLFFPLLALPQSQPLTGAYKLINRNSNLCLAIQGASTLANAEANQWKDDGSTDLVWELMFMGASTYRVKNVNSQLFLGLKNPSYYNGEKVTQRADPRGTTQELNWVFVNAGNGYYKIQNQYSGLFLTVENSSFESGRAVIQWGDQGQRDILWKLVPASAAYPSQYETSHNPYLTSRSQPSSTVLLTTKTFNFPGGGYPNNNQYIGDFCCTGETAPVMDNSNACVGYIYFLSSRKPTYNAPGGLVMSDLEILLSGAREFGKPQAFREKGSVYFTEGQVYVGAQMNATVGRILYAVRITDLKFEVINGRNTGRFYLNSVKVAVTAQTAY